VVESLNGEVGVDNAHHKTYAEKQYNNLDAVVKEEIDSRTQWRGGIQTEDAIH
jgi:hypothetical protein